MEPAVSVFGQSGVPQDGSQTHTNRKFEKFGKYEPPRQWCRTARVYCAPGRGDAWYFQTREGVDVGPYLSQFSAEVEASLLKELLAQENCQDRRLSLIHRFMQESLELSDNLM